MGIYGIDVSSHQTDHPDLTNKDFMIVKATEGTGYINPRQTAQVLWGREKGVEIGHYHFLHQGDIPGQARYFSDNCLAQPGDTLWIDWESYTNSAGKSVHATSAEKDAMLSEMKRLRPQYKVGLYCNVNFWKSIDTSNNAGDGLWIASYVTVGHPSIEAPWVIQQYSSTPIDKDYANFASKTAFHAWAVELLGDDVALTADDKIAIKAIIDAGIKAGAFKAVWETDAVPALPENPDYATNKFWWAVNVLRDIQIHARSADARVQQLTTALAAVEAKIDHIGDMLSQPGGDVGQSIRDVLNNLTVKVSSP